MAVNSETRTFDQILSTTYDYYRPVLVDNIFKMSALFYKMYSGGKVEHQDGGAGLIFPLMYADNDTAAWYSDDESIDTNVQDGISVAKMPWCQLAASVAFTRKQRRMNSGKSQIINLITAKIRQAEMTLYETFNDAMYGTGNYNDSQTSKALCGLGAMVSPDPESYDVGGIDCSTYTWFKNKVRGNASANYTWIDDSDAPTLATGPVAMRDLYAWCSKGTGGPPDFGLASLSGYNGYEEYMATRQIYRDPDMGKMGFDNIRFRNMTLFWDESCKTENISASSGLSANGEIFYFLNTNFMNMKVDSQTDFIRTEFKRPVNQDSEAALILWMGNWCTTKRSKHGVMENYNSTNVT